MAVLRLMTRSNLVACLGKDRFGLQGDQFFRQSRILIRPAAAKANVDADIAALRPAKLFETLPESRKPLLHLRVVLGAAEQGTDPPHARFAARARRRATRRLRHRQG